MYRPDLVANRLRKYGGEKERSKVTRRVSGLVILVALVAAVGCGREDQPAEVDDFEIHLRGGFEGDAVKVEIDDRQVFAGEVTTNQILSLAETIKTSAVQGNHKLTVRVNNFWVGSMRFTLDRPLFIGVSFSRNTVEEQFYFQLMYEAPVYY